MPLFLRFLVACCPLLVLPLHLPAQQKLPAARQRSYLTKVFRLTDAQTRQLYETNLSRTRPEFFTQPVDSFPTDSLAAGLRRPLPPGYYLVAHAEGPQLVYWLRAVTYRQLVVLDNQVDLTLLVRDSLGRLLPDARVSLPKGGLVPFDAATRTYRLPGKAGRPGLLAVEQGGRTTYHALQQTFPYAHSGRPPQTWRRVLSRVVYGFPLGYLTRPVRQLVGQLRHVSYATTGLVGLLRSPFDAYVREDRQNRREQKRAQRTRQWTGYLVLSQPRYRPGDTLRLKARVLRRRDGRPYRKPLDLWLSNTERRKPVARLQPVRPGTYEYVLPLSDTLGLRLDRLIEVHLDDPKNEDADALVRASFRFEDYELNNTRYTLRAAETPHRRGTTQALFLRGQDANELNLLDARVRLSVTPGTVGRFPGRQVFVPDTLWTRAQPLDATGETRLNLPETALPAANFSYDVLAVFLNGDNERRTQATSVSYALDPGELKLALRHDSLVARYEVRGVGQPHAATLETETINYLGRTVRRTEAVQLPLARPLDVRATSYRLSDATGHAETLYLNPANAGLQLRSDRSHDSIVLAAENPHRLSFWYYVYRGNELVRRGYSPDLALALPAPGPEPWYVSMHYFWAGRLQTAEYNVPLPQHRLLVQAEQPAVVYPGQRVQLRYTVTDGGGRPVPRADLTAYAHTSKFEQSEAPELPDFEPPVAGRLSLRRFGLGAGFENQTAQTGRQPLAWGTWRQRLGLDSLRFYQFLYPDYGAFYEYQTAPGGITQVSPFVVDSGRVQPTVAVYVDGVPVFVAAVNGEEPFALVADSGRHTVAIRTPDRLVTLHDVYLRHLHKLTLSIDPNQSCPDLTVEKRGSLTSQEQEELQRFLILVDKNQLDERVLLRQGNRLQPLGAGRPVPVRGPAGPRYRPTPYNRYDNTTFHLGGPFRPDSVLLRRTDGLRRKFLFEPNYRYTFEPSLLKLRCAQGHEFGSLTTAATFGVLPFTDFAYTEADLKPQPATSYYRAPSPEPVLNNPYNTPAGQGRLVVRLPEPTVTPRENLPPVLYTLITQPGNPKFVRLERGLPYAIHALPAGRYRAALLLADSTLVAPGADLRVQPNGATYVQLDQADVLPKGPAAQALRRRFARLVRERLPKPVPPSAQEIREARREIRVKTPLVPQPGWRVQKGRVEDKQTGEGLPGVTVLLQGTTIGVATNTDGSFELAVPPTGGVLTYSFIGYVTVERTLDNRDILVGMETDTRQLNEVVVTGYGAPQTRREITGSVSTITSYSLSGKAAGVAITGQAAGSPNIMIRGSATMNGSNAPLLIVDGLPFSGKQTDLNPDDIASISVLKGAEAAATFGSRAANGVIIIRTKSGVGGQTALGLKPDQATGPDGLPSASRDPRLALRRRFSDSGWWRPTLITDQQGRASTTVTVPDDITGWDTFVLASDDHARTGTFTALMRSFKAVLGELAAPRFLIQGDRAQLIGKALNYLPDTAQVTTSFRVGEGPGRTQRHQLVTAVLDTLTITAPADVDSVQVSFSLAQPNGYQDGELRSIPVLPAGTRERVGTFAVVTASDTTFTLPVRPELGEVTVRLESDPLPTLLDEIRHVQRYAYLCNEQAASKLKTLLLEQRIRTMLQQEFKGEKDVHRLVRHLLRGRHQPEGLWGTWPTSPVSPWVSLHVVEALLEAEKQGYTVKFDREALRSYLLKQLDYAFADAAVRVALTATPAGRRLDELYFRSDDDRIRLLQVLHRLGAQPDFRSYVARFEREQKGRQPLDRYLALANLRQQLGLPFQLDSLRRYRLRTELGGAFYADTLRPGSFYRYLLPDRTANTLLAYRLLRAKGGQEAELTRIRTFLLQQRSNGSHWGSTYEAAQILETIVPDLLVSGGNGLVARAQLSGALTQEVTKFPFTATVAASAGALTLHKEGGLPVYATAYQSFWNAAPEAKAAPFGVRTTLAGQEGSRVKLRAGQPTELLVTVDVKAEARYVLLEVPIPAGCSYGEKAPGNYFEVHREYLRQQVGIFMDVLPVGRHTFRVTLQPRYRGRYTVNPAKAELMYFPTKFGRSASKQAVVE
ncbi:carboxypeptidase-like regulatory domain-containing protein [Microvirga sp. STR05]|uniref:Carboxypeptidase-like regulatory domain-containing protein n=1 Tax=Hymenobacter duratus TaxID=2771356 RepID=A0ABR8JMU9_9BACT|nr:carboxypeptidase-like regulatory domain-containing protein [Hymenobacter duratus]MBD2716084.1 carboxypeptidase-like regulatory domain-containing protein [Hymenobacter duratus]MBR7950998.1 carboxypeptidase-like regulatory domain-containing protein [Microvirga sp. STR05]